MTTTKMSFIEVDRWTKDQTWSEKEHYHHLCYEANRILGSGAPTPEQIEEFRMKVDAAERKFA